MKSKLILLSSVLALGVIAAIPAFAANSTSTKQDEKDRSRPEMVSTTTISCVGTAANIREITLDSAVVAHATAITNAYTARATALKAAYTLTTASDVKKAVKDAWSAFNSAVRSASKDWRTAQKSAWVSFRTSVKACKAPGSIGDNEHAMGEISGD